MIDFHNHLIPGVDDGAVDLEQSRAALAALRAQGVRTVVATPHLLGSTTLEPARLEEAFQELDPAWEAFRALAAAAFPEVRVERGLEIMLDAPGPDLSDPRTRLAGTPFVLVEFPYLTVPPHSVRAVFELRGAGWTPVIAHPERYAGLDPELSVLADWRRVGGLLQVNHGSLLGRYGGTAQAIAWRLLRRGWASYLCSDYHARGRLPVEEARAKLLEEGGEERLRLLTEENPSRLLAGEPPLEVPPIGRARRPFWRRLFGP